MTTIIPAKHPNSSRWDFWVYLLPGLDLDLGLDLGVWGVSGRSGEGVWGGSGSTLGIRHGIPKVVEFV